METGELFQELKKIAEDVKKQAYCVCAIALPPGKAEILAAIPKARILFWAAGLHVSRSPALPEEMILITNATTARFYRDGVFSHEVNLPK